MVHLDRLMSEQRHFVKSATIITALTLLSRICGYIRDSRVAFLLGTGMSADAYQIAYRIPNLLRRLVGEGAVNAAVIPVFSQYLTEDQKAEGWKFVNSLLTLLTIVLTSVTVLGILFSPFLVRILAWGFAATPGKLELTAMLNRIMFPYLILISFSALAMGVSNSFHKFATSAVAPVFLNLSVIVFSFLSTAFEKPEVALAVGVVVGGILQLAIQIPAAWRSGWRPHFRIDLLHPGVRRVGRLLGPIVFGVSIVHVNVLVDTQFASFLREGSVMAIYIADRIMELVLGGYTVAISTAILPLLSKQAARRNMDELKATLNQATRLILFITAPAAVGLIVMRTPIIEVLFQRGDFDEASTALAARPLLFFAMGLSAFSMIKVVVPAFYALQDTRTPVKVAFISMILNFVFNLVFIIPLENGGPPLATSLSAFFGSLMLMTIFCRRYGSYDIRGILRSLRSFAIAAAVLGIVAWTLIQWPGFYIDQSKAQKTFALAVTIAAAAGAYFAMLFLLRAREMYELREIFGGRRETVIEAAREQSGVD